MVLWLTVKHPKSCVRIEEVGKRVSVIRERERGEKRMREQGKFNLQNNIHGDRIAGKRFHYIQR